MMDTPYAVLGLNPDADEEAIERAYRQRVKETHPDHGGSMEAFRAVRTAYERLTADRAADESPDGDPADDVSDDWNHWTSPSRVTYLNYDVLADHGWEHTDPGLFEKAAAADLNEADYGQFRASPGRSLLEAAEDNGLDWPFSCRGGACANCAILLHDGELSMPVNHVLPSEMLERDVRLSCNGIPITKNLQVIYNVKHMPALDDLLLPPRPSRRTSPGD
jgi:ferredoxin